MVENSLLKAVPEDLWHRAWLMNPKRWCEQVIFV